MRGRVLAFVNQKGLQMFSFTVVAILDAGKVRLGGQGPVFKPVADAGKVRLGGQGPLFR